MRHSFISFICVSAALAAMVSCAKETGFIEPKDNSGVKGITVKAVAGIDTKTYIEDGDIPVVKWSDNDKMVIFEMVADTVAGAAVSSSASIDDAGKASFSATLDWDAEDGSSFMYAAAYPSSAVYDMGESGYLLYLPPDQTLQGNNFSSDSDVLFSEVEDYGDTRIEDGEQIMFRLHRLGTIVRMTLKGIPAGEKIKQIKMEAPVYMSGTIAYDPVTGTVDPESAFNTAASSLITLSTDGLEATGADVVWFRVMAERDWGQEGDKLAFEVLTDKNTYKKEIASCPAIKFKDGGLTKFSVDLSSSAVEPYPVPYSESFEDGAKDWTFIDNDGDGINWEVYAQTPNSGSNSLSSYSYFNGYGALTPDNWAFTPPVQLTEGNYLSFWVRAGYTAWPAEHYAVYLAENSPLGETTVLMAETEFPYGDPVDIGSDGVYQRYVIQIPAEFDNKTVCIGFRHFNCTDQYWISLDDVEITESNPAVIDANYEDYLGVWANGSKSYSIEQKVEGESYSITGLKGQGDYPVEAKFENGSIVLYEQEVYSSETEEGSTNVWLQGSDGYFPEYPTEGDIVIFKGVYDKGENKINISPRNAFEYYMFITYLNEERQDYAYEALPSSLVPYVPDTSTYIYQEDFEDFDGSAWTLIDADGDGHCWETANNHHTYSGDIALTSASYDSANLVALNPDNWAFTPAITLTSDNYLSFWVGAQDIDWPYEHYAVYITDKVPNEENLSDCAVLLPEHEYPEGDPADATEDGYYQRYVIQIPSEYDGKDVYIGFRHFNCTDMFYFNLDYVAVSEGAPSNISTSSVRKGKKLLTKPSALTAMGNNPPKAGKPVIKREPVGLRKAR